MMGRCRDGVDTELETRISVDFSMQLHVDEIYEIKPVDLVTSITIVYSLAA